MKSILINIFTFFCNYFILKNFMLAPDEMKWKIFFGKKIGIVRTLKMVIRTIRTINWYKLIKNYTILSNILE